MTRFWRLWDSLSSGTSICGALWSLFLVLVVTRDVLGRAFFGSALIGTPEIVANSIVGIVFLQLAFSVKEDKHVRATFVIDRYPTFKLIMDFVTNTIGLLLFATIIASNWPLMVSAVINLEFEGAAGVFRFPTFIIRIVLIIGSIFTIGQYLQRLLSLCKGKSAEEKCL